MRNDDTMLRGSAHSPRRDSSSSVSGGSVAYTDIGTMARTVVDSATGSPRESSQYRIAPDTTARMTSLTSHPYCARIFR